MKQVKLDLFHKGVKEKVFDSNGDGKNAYKILQAYWDPDANAMAYRQVNYDHCLESSTLAIIPCAPVAHLK